MGGDNVFNGGAILGFLHAQGIDEYGLVGNGGRHALEFRQLAAGPSQPFKDGGGLKALWRQRFQRWQRNLGHWHPIIAICIEN